MICTYVFHIFCLIFFGNFRFVRDRVVLQSFFFSYVRLRYFKIGIFLFKNCRSACKNIAITKLFSQKKGKSKHRAPYKYICMCNTYARIYTFENILAPQSFWLSWTLEQGIFLIYVFIHIKLNGILLKSVFNYGKNPKYPASGFELVFTYTPTTAVS